MKGRNTGKWLILFFKVKPEAKNRIAEIAILLQMDLGSNRSEFIIHQSGTPKLEHKAENHQQMKKREKKRNASWGNWSLFTSSSAKECSSSDPTCTKSVHKAINTLQQQTKKQSIEKMRPVQYTTLKGIFVDAMSLRTSVGIKDSGSQKREKRLFCFLGCWGERRHWL